MKPDAAIEENFRFIIPWLIENLSTLSFESWHAV